MAFMIINKSPVRELVVLPFSLDMINKTAPPIPRISPSDLHDRNLFFQDPKRKDSNEQRRR